MTMRRRANRRGYALIMVAIFCAMLVTFMGVAWRHMSSTIRTFSARSDQIQSDQGAMMALADAMRALEVGPPPLSTYTCYCIKDVPAMENMMIQCPASNIALYPERTTRCYYQLTFTRLTTEEATTPADDRIYTVEAKKLSAAPAAGSLLNINDFGSAGPL